LPQSEQAADEVLSLPIYAELARAEQDRVIAAVVDFGDMTAGDPAVDRALEELRFHCNSVRLLGTYTQTRNRG
jgi:prephenate dehydratase